MARLISEGKVHGLRIILKRLETKRKLFGFLRRHRHALFDDGFQAELESMDRDTGAGSEPVPPAQLAMALLLQGYLGLSDSDAVEAAAWTAGGRSFSAASGGFQGRKPS